MKMIKRTILGFLLMAGIAYGTPEGDFKKANADYEAGRFEEAAKSYEEILKADGARVPVLRNLGSSYFQMGENGRAILAFERALVIKPRDPDLLANLKLAQDQVAVYPVKSGSGWQSFLEIYSARHWSGIALVCSLFLPLAALAWVLRKGKSRIWIAAFAGVDLVILAIALGGIDARSEEQTRGIVIAKSATVRISPFEKSDDRGTLTEGREVSLGKESNGYFWVTSEDGSQEGWVEKSEVSAVLPRE